MPDDPTIGTGDTSAPDDPATLPDDSAAALAALRDHLQDTGERPVEAAASRWLGEAEAVAADAAAAARGGAPASVVAERVEQVRALLANVEGTGDPAADDHVAAARELADGVLATLDDEQ